MNIGSLRNFKIEDIYKLKKIQMTNPLFNKTINHFCFSNLGNHNYNEINNHKNLLPIIIIDNYTIQFEAGEEKSYLILCFDNILLVLLQNDIDFLISYFCENRDSKIYCLSYDNQNLIDFFTIHKLHFSKIEEEPIFMNKEIPNFKSQFNIMNQELKLLWKMVQNCICGYLIKKSYFQCQNGRIKKYQDFFHKNEEKIASK